MDRGAIMSEWFLLKTPLCFATHQHEVEKEAFGEVVPGREGEGESERAREQEALRPVASRLLVSCC